MVSLKLNQKLLSLWFGSILFSLFLFGGVFVFLNNEFNETTLRHKIDDAFVYLDHQLKDRNRYLILNGRSLAKRDDIIASLSMIHNYQDPADYQAILFDVEKKNLARELSKLLMPDRADIITAYDGDLSLCSFAYFDEQGLIHIGYISYENEMPKYFVSGKTIDDFHEVEILHPWVEEMNSEINYQEHVRTYQGGVVMGFHVPVVSHSYNESEEIVGMITVARLGNSFAEDISKRTGLNFMFSVNNNDWVAAGHDVQGNNLIEPLSDVFLIAGDWQNLQWIDLNEFIYGVANYPLDDGGSINFVFSENKNRSDFIVFQKAMILVLLVNVLLLLPLGVYFLKCTVLRPVDNLVLAIESLSGGRYKKLPVPSGNDEMAFLSNSFNSMASSIQIRETELQKLSLAVEQSPVSIIITNLNADIEYVNPAFTKVTGYTFDEVVGENTRIRQGGETPVEIYRQLWETIVDGGQWQGIMHNRNKNGDLIWESTSITPIKSSDGKVINYLALSEDITQRRQIDEQLYLQSEALQAAADAIVITDINGIIQWVNPAYEKMTGYAVEEVIGKNTRILKSGRQDNFFYERLWHTILSGSTWYGELYNKRKDGSIYLEEESITPVMDVSGDITNFVAIKRDITSNRQHEEIVRQSRKLEAIGEMAGGIAHDFNNLLGILSGNLEILKRYAGDNADMNKWIDSGLKTTKRGAALTRRLLGFSRVHAAEVKVTSISSSLKEMRSMIEKSVGSGVTMNYELANDLWLTDIDVGDFEDAMINMAINARDAMQGTGRLDISAFNETKDEENASKVPGCEIGDYVVLCISDSGSGISKEVQQCMFDPFYSTKEKGKGTGLGLSMVHGFVRRSHGCINVISEPGAGATFFIYLPRSVKDKINDLDSEMNSVLPTGSETILVVDDEAQLVEVATIYLSDLGYRVLQATNPRQALAFLQGSEKIDLLFSDIVMPGAMNGYDLVEAALELRPELKVLLVSGYTPEDNDLNPHARHLTAMRLGKPYGRVELAQRIRLELDREK